MKKRRKHRARTYALYMGTTHPRKPGARLIQVYPSEEAALLASHEWFDCSCWSWYVRGGQIAGIQLEWSYLETDPRRVPR